jgi:hypothetical protein
MEASGTTDIVSMLLSLLANDGRRGDTNDDAREEGAELLGEIERSGVA